MDICKLHELCGDETIAITKHARMRLAERGISVENVKNAILTGEIIEQYENDKPFPSCLILGLTEDQKHIHIVASIDNGFLYVITAYYPSESEWDKELKVRRESKL